MFLIDIIQQNSKGVTTFWTDCTRGDSKHTHFIPFSTFFNLPLTASNPLHPSRPLSSPEKIKKNVRMGVPNDWDDVWLYQRFVDFV